jgi:hypothetical protein
VFGRIRYAARVLRDSQAVDSPAAVDAEIRRYRATVATDWFGEERPPRNPGVVLIEITLAVLVAGYVVGPLIKYILLVATPKAQALMTGFASFGFYYALRKLEDKVSFKGALRPLDPYLGHRIIYAITTLTGRNVIAKTKAS